MAWTPEIIFLCSCGVAAVGGFGRLLGSDQPLTVRNMAHALLVHGTVGGGLAGVGYEYLGWKGRPLAMLGFSALYGGGVVGTRLIAQVAENAIGLLAKGGPGEPRDPE
jgi:hypothetical protein